MIKEFVIILKNKTLNSDEAKQNNVSGREIWNEDLKRWTKKLFDTEDTEQYWEWKRIIDLKVKKEATLLDQCTENFVEPLERSKML